jgi:hypothetical protein
LAEVLVSAAGVVEAVVPVEVGAAQGDAHLCCEKLLDFPTEKIFAQHSALLVPPSAGHHGRKAS